MSNNDLMLPREIVKANNDLFRSKSKIKDVLAGRIFLAFASLVDEKDIKNNQSFVEYKISANSIMKNLNPGGDNYKQLKNAAYSLVDQKIEFKKSKNSFTVYTLFSKIDYTNGIITGEFHKDLIPFFITLKGMFTRINLEQYMKLPSIYSQKLFCFLKSWDDKPNIEIKLNDLHELLNTPESFRNKYSNFKQRVLEKACKDINELTDLKFSWQPIKTKNMVTSISFIFQLSEKMKGYNNKLAMTKMITALAQQKSFPRNK